MGRLRIASRVLQGRARLWGYMVGQFFHEITIQVSCRQDLRPRGDFEIGFCNCFDFPDVTDDRVFVERLFKGGKVYS